MTARHPGASNNRQEQAPLGLAPTQGYSHVATGTGRLVVVAGQVALDGQGDLVGERDVQRQAEQVFDNIGRALEAAGATFADVVKLTYYVIDIGSLPLVRIVRDRYVDVAHPPASTAVGVTALVRPEFLIEIDALAIVADS